MSNYKIDQRFQDRLPKLAKADKELAISALKNLEALRNSAQKVGEALTQMSDNGLQALYESMPSHITTLLKNCYKVGQGEMHPKLATASGRSAQALKKLKYEQQEEYIVNLIPVALGAKDDCMMDYEDMSISQVHQVFAQGHKHARVRTLDEQRQWLREQAKKKKALEAKQEHTEINRPNKWAIRNGRVHLAPKKVQAGLTLQDIEAIRKDLKL